MRHHSLAVVDSLAVSRRDRGGLRRTPILWLSLLLVVILAAINAAIPTSVYANTSGPMMAGTGSQVPGPGSSQWTNPEYVTANDTNYATVQVTQGGFFGYYHTYYLQGTNFGFSIPSGSTINGIRATVGRMTSGVPTGIRDDNLFLIKGGTIAGEDKSTEADWPNMVIGEAYYGGPADNWGLAWTAEDINAANFGLALCVYNASWLYPYTAYVDYMQITVTYTLPDTTTTIVTSGTPSTYGDNVTFTATVAAGAGTNTPSGSVTFMEGSTPLGTGTLSGSSGTATAAYSTTSLTVGTHSNITAVYGGDSNFTGSTSSSISQTVNARSLTVTASSRSKTYGDTVTFAGTEFTTAGLVNSDTVTSVTLTSPGAGASATVGTYSIVPSAAVGTGLSNYSISYANGTLTVNQKALTITANNRSKTYGDVVTFAGTEFTTSGLVNSDTVTSVTLTSSGASAAATVAASPYSIVPSAAAGSGLANYTISYVNGSLTVSAKALTITADDRSKTYGDTVTFAGTEFTASGLVNSDSVTSLTLTSSGADAAAYAGSYSINPSNASGSGLANYSISYVNGTLTVNPKALTITATTNTRTYDGGTTAAAIPTASGLVGSDTVSDLGETYDNKDAGTGKTLSVATYTINDGNSGNNYSVTLVTNTTGVINKRDVTVTATGINRVYDGTTTASATLSTDALGGDTVTASFAGASFADKNAGSGKAVGVTGISISGADAANYNLLNATASTTANITQRDLTVTATGINKVYDGTTTASATLSTDALGGDAVTASYAGASFADKNAGSGKAVSVTGISISGADAANYNLLNTTASTTANVTQRDLTVTANNRLKTHGTTVTFAGTEFTAAGLVTGDSMDSVTLTSAGADASAAIGNYPIVPSNAAGTGLTNYRITYVNGTMTVSARALTVTANDDGKTYGDTLTFAGTEFTVIGLEAGDSIDSVTLTSTGAMAAANAGTYSIIPGDAVGTGLGDYTISYVNGTLTVGLRDLTVTAIGVNRVYDGTTYAMVMLSTDALGGDAVTARCTSASFDDKNAGSSKAVSVTGISISGADAANYNLLNTTASTTADITRKALTITADSRGKAYRDIITFAGTEFTTEGLIGSDTVDSVTLASAGAEATAAAGAYDIVPGAAAGNGLENYSITYINGSLAVNKVSLTWTVTSSPASSAPGGTVTFTATVSDTEATGTVTFVDGDVILGTAPLDHGVATLTISDISAGSHSVTVAYDGDTNFADGTSPAYICQVDAASKSSWWLIVCIAAGVIGVFLFLLFFWRRRKPRQALAANAIGSATGMAVDDAGTLSASADSLPAEDAVAGNTPPAIVENETSGDVEAAVAGVGASAVLLEGEQKAEYSTEATLQEIRRVVETAAPDVAAHQNRVSELAGSIAREMGLADRQIDGIRLAAELHDIGKVIEPAEGPTEPGKPSQADTSTIWDHPKVAFDLLRDVEFDWPIARIVAQHHERLDGSGYPYGIPGKDILLEARIIAVADTMDDMLSSHPHRPAMSPEEALAELADGDGSLYDSEVVQACEKVINQRGSEVELSSPHP